MKQFILTLLVILCLTSCIEPKNQQCDSNIILTNNDSNIFRLRATEFVYNNHSYILFREGMYENLVGTIIHSPDCNCNKLE